MIRALLDRLAARFRAPEVTPLEEPTEKPEAEPESEDGPVSLRGTALEARGVGRGQ